VLQKEAGEDRHGDADRVEAEHDEPGVSCEEGGGEQRVYRQPCPARHERRHEARHEPVACAVERACGHDRGDRAPEADHHRDEGSSWESDAAHEPVHYVGGARHVTRVLEDRERDEHREDDRDEGRHGLDSRADAAGDERDEPLGRAERCEPGAEPVDEDGSEQDVEEVDEGAADKHGEPEDEVHHSEEDRERDDSVQYDAVDAFGDRRAREGFARDVARETVDDPVLRVGDCNVNFLSETLAGRADHGVEIGGAEGRCLEKLTPDPRVSVEERERGPPCVRADQRRQRFCLRNERGDRLFERGGIRDLEPRGRGVGHGVGDRVLHAHDVLRADARGGDDRAAEVLGEVVDVYGDAFLLGDVDHVEYDEHGHAHLDEPEREKQVALYIGGVDDVHHEVGFSREQVVARDRLILRARRERVDPGEVDHPDGRALGDFGGRARRGSGRLSRAGREGLHEQAFGAAGGEAALLPFDRDARPVSDALSASGEAVEDRGLAAVRIPDDRDGGGGRLLGRGAHRSPLRRPCPRSRRRNP